MYLFLRLHQKKIQIDFAVLQFSFLEVTNFTRQTKSTRKHLVTTVISRTSLELTTVVHEPIGLMNQLSLNKRAVTLPNPSCGPNIQRSQMWKSLIFKTAPTSIFQLCLIPFRPKTLSKFQFSSHLVCSNSFGHKEPFVFISSYIARNGYLGS